VIYLPAGARKPVPLLLNISFSANSTTVNDPGIKPGEVWGREKKKVPAAAGMNFGRINVAPLLERGIGFATVYYGDIDPDFLGGVLLGVRALYLKKGQTEPAPDEWGAISAWAWGLSRAMDYLETDKGVDARRVAHLTEPTRYPYQFCANYAKFARHVGQLPVDAHMLVALIAPRPVLLQTGDQDQWSDPKGEFLAAVAAGPVFRLLGKQGLDTDQWPPAGQPILHTIGYYMHAGGHGTIPSDWDIYLKFMEMHLHPGQ
jgi:hypothetical protein